LASVRASQPLLAVGFVVFCAARAISLLDRRARSAGSSGFDVALRDGGCVVRGEYGLGCTDQ
jgi:hypothetical protein